MKRSHMFIIIILLSVVASFLGRYFSLKNYAGDFKVLEFRKDTNLNEDIKDRIMKSYDSYRKIVNENAFKENIDDFSSFEGVGDNENFAPMFNDKDALKQAYVKFGQEVVSEFFNNIYNLKPGKALVFEIELYGIKIKYPMQ